MATLALELKKMTIKQNMTTFYSHSKAEKFINESDIDDVFESIYIIIISNIQKCLEKGSGWIMNLAIDHKVNISK